MVAVAYILQIVLMVGIPVALWLTVRCRWATSWRLIGCGVLTFVASQLVHLPLASAFGALVRLPGFPLPSGSARVVLNAIVLGLLAGTCEQGANYVALRRWVPRARGFRDAIGFGAGHGGGESVILGLVASATLVFMVLRRGADGAGVPAGNSEQLAEAVTAYWSVPPWLPILGGIERASAILVHLATTALVMLSFARNALWPLVTAILWHALVDGTAVYAVARSGVVAAEGIVFAFGVASLIILRWARRGLED